MLEENEDVVNPTVETVPESSDAGTNDEVNTPAPADTPEETKAPKTFTQEELDAIVNKRLAIERRKRERENAQIEQTLNRKVQDSPLAPTADQFETVEEYAEALAEFKAEEKIILRQKQEQESRILKSYGEREAKAIEKYDDFEQVAYNPKLAVTPTMAETIRESDIGPDIAYHLGCNPSEAERIANLSSTSQIKELAKLELKLSSEPVIKKISNAPTPVNPISARSPTSSSYDTTDPRSVSTMSTSEWIAAENRRLMKKVKG